MAHDQPDTQKPDDLTDILSPGMLRAELDDLRAEMRAFTLSQTDGLRAQIEHLETTGEATRVEVDLIRKGFRRIQAEMKQGFAGAREEQSSTRQEIAGMRLEFTTISVSFPKPEQFPSAELMVEIKAVLQERRDILQAKKDTRTRIRGGFIGLVFIVLGAVIAEPVKRWLGKYTGWW